jgi:plasmid replication initiation protein
MGQMKLEFMAEEEEVVKKANQLIRARHDFTMYEQRIFAAMVAKLDRNADSFPVQEIPISRICERSNSSDLYRRIDDITTRLVDQKIIVRTTDEDGTREFKKVNVFGMCRYREGEGVLEAQFTEAMRPYLLGLSERFTLYLITIFLRLRSKYSTQIYELLKMREDLGKVEMPVERFRGFLGLEDKYPKFFNLKSRVIEQARTELKEKADIYFTYKVKRKGQKPVKLLFFIHRNDMVVDDLEESLPVPEPDGPSEGPNLNPKKMFMRELSQEELEGLSGQRLDEIYQEARARAQRANQGRSSKVLMKQQTLSYMETIWEREE